MRGAWLFGRGARLLVLTPSPPRHEAQLKDPEGTESQNHHRPEDHREEQCHREGKLALKEQEVDFDVLEVLQDEDEDHDQDDDADDKGRPGSTQARLALARERWSGLCLLASGLRHYCGNRKRRRQEWL